MMVSMRAKTSRDGNDSLDEGTAAEHPRHGFADAHAAVDVRRQHSRETESALEGQRHEDENGEADEAGIEDGLERIAFRILELPRVADRRLEPVGGPGRDEETSKDENPTRLVPKPVDGIAVRIVPERHERQEVLTRQIAREQRNDADQHQGQQRRHTHEHGRARGTQDTAMLDQEAGQHQDQADEEGRVDAQRQPFLDRAEIEQGDLPRVDGSIGREEEAEDVAGAEP